MRKVTPAMKRTMTSMKWATLVLIAAALFIVMKISDRRGRRVLLHSRSAVVAKNNKHVSARETLEHTEFNFSLAHEDLLKKNLLWMQNLTISPEIKRQQLERMSRVKKVCQERIPQFGLRYSGRNFYISYRGVDGALLPKTGSTNILRTICILVGTKCTSITGYPDEYHYVPRFTKGVSNLTVYTEEMNNWSTRPFFYVFVRNPWQRLVSTYIEKVLFTDSYIEICSRYGNKKFTKCHRERKARNETFTFEDFLECCVIEHYRLGGMNGMEPHYKPQSLTGTFCDVSYSFIGKTETYGEDIIIILGQYGVTDIPTLMEEAKKYRKSNEKQHLTSKNYLKLWKSINKQIVDMIRHIYVNDLVMFDYPMYPF